MGDMSSERLFLVPANSNVTYFDRKCFSLTYSDKCNPFQQSKYMPLSKSSKGKNLIHCTSLFSDCFLFEIQSVIYSLSFIVIIANL